MPSHTASMHAFTGLLPVPGLRPADAMALMQAAQGDRGAGALAPRRVLEGRHVALVTSNEPDPSADVFVCAARALGARVARIAPADLELERTASAGDTARLLGRLYAAVGCAGVDAKSVAMLRLACGIPVLHDLAGEAHASRLLADVMTLQAAQRVSAGGAGASAQAPALAPGSPRARLGVCGPARSALQRAWKAMAVGAGVDVIGLSAQGAEAHDLGCDFICRPGRPPELLALRGGGPRDAPRQISLAEQQRSNHCLVVQALLRNELGSRA